MAAAGLGGEAETCGLPCIKQHIFSVAEASACARDALTEDREKRSSTATKDLGASLPSPLFAESVSHER